ncbi:hypothetical protein D3C76_1165410 [compost metagenome]
MIIIDFFHVLNQFVQTDVIKVFVIALRNVVVRMFRVFLAQHREDNVISVKITRRFEEFIAIKLHALTQRKCIGFAVRRNGPRLRQ